MEGTKFRTFEDLEAYKAVRAFRIRMYAVSRRLPAFEKFEMASQVRRAALSLTNNIAEGHGRFHLPDRVKFMLQARGSLQELLDDLNACSDEKYLSVDEVAELRNEGWGVLKVLNGYLRWLRDRKLGEGLELHDTSVAYKDPSDADLEAWLGTFEFDRSPHFERNSTFNNSRI